MIDAGIRRRSARPPRSTHVEHVGGGGGESLRVGSAARPSTRAGGYAARPLRAPGNAEQQLDAAGRSPRAAGSGRAVEQLDCACGQRRRRPLARRGGRPSGRASPQTSSTGQRTRSRSKAVPSARAAAGGRSPAAGATAARSRWWRGERADDLRVGLAAGARRRAGGRPRRPRARAPAGDRHGQREHVRTTGSRSMISNQRGMSSPAGRDRHDAGSGRSARSASRSATTPPSELPPPRPAAAPRTCSTSAPANASSCGSIAPGPSGAAVPKPGRSTASARAVGAARARSSSGRHVSAESP